MVVKQMITFHLREFTHPFFQHTLVIPAQDISIDENMKGYKYLQFSGCEHVALRLLSIGFKCIDEDTFEYYVEIGQVQVRPFYDKITIEIISKENGQVYDTITHRQDILADSSELAECVELCEENDEWTQLELANMWEEDEVDYTL